MKIPTSFEGYRAKWDADVEPRRREEGRESCTGCGKPAERLTADGYCDTCLHYDWGFDQAQELAVVSLLGGAVRSALEADVSAELIRRTVDEAIDEAHEDNMNSLVADLRRAKEGMA